MRHPVEILMEKYKNNIYVIAFNICKNSGDAEDVVQDTFIQYMSLKKDFESEESSELFEAVMTLPEKYRITIHLFYYEDYSVNEIADIQKISVSKVKTRLSRGRMLLKEKLKEAWNYDE